MICIIIKGLGYSHYRSDHVLLVSLPAFDLYHIHASNAIAWMRKYIPERSCSSTLVPDSYYLCLCFIDQKVQVLFPLRLFLPSGCWLPKLSYYPLIICFSVWSELSVHICMFRTTKHLNRTTHFTDHRNLLKLLVSM